MWSATNASGQAPQGPGGAPEQGRWHVQTTSGDSPAQIATRKPVAFDGWYTCISQLCGGQPLYAHDSTICDTVDFENQSSGLVINGTTAALQFGVSGGFLDNFVYTFVGTLSANTETVDGATTLKSATITGTYGSTPGGCNNGTPLLPGISSQGTFIATWYPPMSGKFYGALVPVDVTISQFELELVLTPTADGSLTGTATTGRLLEIKGEWLFIPVQSACFSSTTLIVTRGTAPNLTGAPGNRFKITAIDTAGNDLHLEGVAIQSGSNRQYTVQYGILGGVCSGQSAITAGFSQLTVRGAADRPALRREAPREPTDPSFGDRPIANRSNLRSFAPATNYVH